MTPSSRSLAAIAVGLLVVLAGCSVLAPGETPGETTPGPSTPTATGGADATDSPTPTSTSTPTPTSTPTSTPTDEPTPTPDPDTGLLVVEVSTEGETLNDEYVVLKNAGSTPLDLSGWRVRDDEGHVHTFADSVRLESGERLTLHSGRGSQTGSDRYWWSDESVWDDGGDTVYVYDERGQKVFELPYQAPRAKS